MSNWDNQSTRLEQERLRAEFDTGMVEGYDLPISPLPAIAYKIPRDWTARERGYALGWLIKMDELLGER